MPPIAYAAHTSSCTFFLDDEGICRQIVRRAASMKLSAEPDAIGRCIGAQYVASLDLAVDGGLVAMPKVGSPLLFAYIGESGRIALVRTGNLVRFEQKGPAAYRAAKPDSGVHRAPAPHDVDDEDDEAGIETQRFTLDLASLARTAQLHVARAPQPEPRRGVLPRRHTR